MRNPLCAFLFLRLDAGEWKLETTQDLESIVRSWRLHSSTNPSGAAVLHIGFEPMQTDAFEGLRLTHPGRVLLTAAAKNALPPKYRSSTAPIGRIEQLDIFLGLTGWGYEAEDVAAGVGAPDAFVRPHDWLVQFVADNPEVAEALADAGIRDDETYLANEQALDRKLREQVGVARCLILMASHKADPCAFARAAPPWFQNREFKSLRLSVRVENVFNSVGIATVKDLASYTEEALLKMRNFGRTSVAGLYKALQTGLQQGVVDKQSVEQKATKVSFLDSVRQSLSALLERDRDILASRMGLACAEETLAEIGVRYKLSRERVRQLEADKLQELLTYEPWAGVLASKLTALVDDQYEPLNLTSLAAQDSWFAGVDTARSAFCYIVTALTPQPAQFIEVDGALYLGLINQDQWDQAVGTGQRLIAASTDAGWTESQCQDEIAALLPEAATEFRALLWSKVAQKCHFSGNGTEDRVLVSYGCGAGAIVGAVLQDAEQPLHYEEIFERVKARGHGENDVRRVHTAAAEVGYLFGRGTYGLMKHLSLGAEDLEALAEQAEDIVAEGPEGRQWHARELLNLLVEGGSLQGRVSDQYVLNIALQRSQQLRYLGRLVWAQPESDVTAQGRIDIRQAIISILYDAGEPLKGREITHRLTEKRGIGQSIQLQPSWPLIRVGPALWGLADRDVPLSADERAHFIADLVSLLEWRRKGIHLSELWEVMPPVSGLTAEAAFSLAELDERLNVSVGRFLYLNAWGEPRRERLSEAVDGALRRLGRPASYDEIVTMVEARFDRPLDRISVSQCLSNLGKLNAESGLWELDEKQQEQSDLTDRDRMDSAELTQ